MVWVGWWIGCTLIYLVAVWYSHRRCGRAIQEASARADEWEARYQALVALGVSQVGSPGQTVTLRQGETLTVVTPVGRHFTVTVDRACVMGIS